MMTNRDVKKFAFHKLSGHVNRDRKVMVSLFPNENSNGADEIRTHDLLHAMQALSQLSYGPVLTV